MQRISLWKLSATYNSAATTNVWRHRPRPLCTDSNKNHPVYRYETNCCVKTIVNLGWNIRPCLHKQYSDESLDSSTVTPPCSLDTDIIPLDSAPPLSPSPITTTITLSPIENAPTIDNHKTTSNNDIRINDTSDSPQEHLIRPIHLLSRCLHIRTNKSEIS